MHQQKQQNRKAKGLFRTIIFVLIISFSLCFFLFFIYRLSSIFFPVSSSESNTLLSTNGLRGMITLDMKSKGVPTDLLMKSTSLFSYTATLEEYRTKIIGIDYRNNENDKELRKTPQEPTYFTIQDLLLNWPADNTNPSYWAKSKAHPLNSKNDYIARFDYSDLLSRSLAEEYRRKEIPFILTNVKELADAAEDSFSLQNLLSSFGTASKVVEHSATNHFTYYVDKPSVIKDIDPTWTPPQVEEKMPFPSFLHLAEEVCGCRFISLLEFHHYSYK